MSRISRLRGHVMTLGPFVARSLRPPVRPHTVPWEMEVDDPEIGPVRITGRYLPMPSNEVLVVLHGLGGSVESGYMALALAAAHAEGRSCLLLNCRGSDRLGADIYHSGLTTDLAAALRSPELRNARRLDLFGYSIGGHIVLRYACESVDPRLGRVAAVGAPLDLAAAAADFDARGFNVYRTHVMDSLKEIYTAAYQRRPQGISPVRARGLNKIRDWDEHVVAPRFRFESASHYYRSQSVGPILSDLKVEALYVGASYDPMVSALAIRPFLSGPNLTSVWEDGAGHLGFRADFDLGLPGPRGLESQVLRWLSRS